MNRIPAPPVLLDNCLDNGRLLPDGKPAANAAPPAQALFVAAETA